MNKIIEAIQERRSCRSFDSSKSVGQKELEAVLAAAASAPSAMNRQAWRFTVIRNAETLEQLNGAVYEVSDDTTRERITNRCGGKFNFFYNAEILIIVSCGKNAAYPEADAACALENMFLAAASLGIGSCWINQLTGKSGIPAVRRFLRSVNIPDENTVYGCCALGYPASKPPAAKELKSGTVDYIL